MSIKYVLKLKREHLETWRGQSDSYWFMRLSQEIGELGGSLAGDHPHPPEWELMQIASICLNWLDKIKAEKEPAQ